MAYLLVMAFVQRFDTMVGMLKIVSGLTLLVSALLAVLPIGIVVFWPKAEEEEAAPASEEGETGDAGEELHDESSESPEGEEGVPALVERQEDAVAVDQDESVELATESHEDIYEADSEVEMDFDDFMADDDEKA